jgi:N-acetylglutamate synthase-like GNAT family acetyltransferase
MADLSVPDPTAPTPPSGDLQVRRARPEDASAIEALYRALVVGDDNIHVLPARIAALAEDPHNHLLVAEREGTVCGTAFVTMCLDPMYGFLPYAVVENIVVLSETRGQGAGRALMVAVEELARAARCTKLVLTSGAARSEAHGFFRHLGFDGDKKRAFIKYINRVPPLRRSR